MENIWLNVKSTIIGLIFLAMGFLYEWNNDYVFYALEIIGLILLFAPKKIEDLLDRLINRIFGPKKE